MALVPLLVLAQGMESVDSPRWTRKYDIYFRKYTKRYFGPGFEWRWFKAQAIVESGLDPRARGKYGGIGIMQIRPATFAEIKEKQPHLENLHDPRWNIAAGIFYDRLLFDRWEDRDPLINRLSFTFASYNAGFSRIKRAARQAKAKGKDPRLWHHVAPFAPPITRRYVEKIKKLMHPYLHEAMEALDRLHTSTLSTPPRLSSEARA
ncbi:MAG: murein transglycosylase [Gammaproteobacteria bacterium]|nr:MAG: murein transglycosylase [Gammaproteobacteria bacterium]